MGAAAVASALGLAASAQAAVVIVNLTPVYPGTISGSTPYSTNETLEYKFTINAPYHFTFTATGSGGNFPFPISTTATGSSGPYTEIYGPFPVHGTVNYTLTTAVPEPASWALMIIGVAGVGAGLRRRKTALAAV